MAKNGKHETTKQVLKVNRDFYKKHGFYPNMAWIAKKIGKTRERVRQVFMNYRGERLKNDDQRFFVVRGSHEIQIHPKMMKEIEKIELDHGLSFREALKSWSYNKYKKKK